ncbi:hypothetical protein DENSPDRAFT_615196 [Dentipellis sp. KUC8613]|nr:hypothetical protein DENSPDRAFT_615196 [Dentipellis sp. KUC8613]
MPSLRRYSIDGFLISLVRLLTMLTPRPMAYEPLDRMIKLGQLILQSLNFLLWMAGLFLKSVLRRGNLGGGELGNCVSQLAIFILQLVHRLLQSGVVGDS